MSQKPLPLGEVSPKVTERARTLTEMSEHSDNIALIKAFDYRCIPSLLSHACPLRRSAPALPKGEPLTEGVHSMKSERSYPIYKVNKSRGQPRGRASVGIRERHPRVPGGRARERHPRRRGEPEGRLPWHRLRLSQEQDPRPPHLPQRQRHLRRQLLAPPHRVRLGLPQDRPRARRPLGLPGHLRRGRPVPRPDRGPLQQHPRHPDPQRRHGEAEARPLPLLAEVLRADGQTIDGIYERNDEALRAKEGLEQSKGWFELPGESHPASTQTEICENGVYYHVDFENGQKTGFFLDQKYNRRAVARLAAGHTVLDCFTHTGSFALNAASGGAARVTAADISADAIAMAQRNAERNGLTNMDFLCEDTFELLPRLEKEGHPYDFIIILDPPAFTKARRTVENAMRGYKEINYRAMRLLPGAATSPRQAALILPPRSCSSGCCAPPQRTLTASCAKSKCASGPRPPHPLGRAGDELSEVFPVSGHLKSVSVLALSSHLR